MIRIAVDAMGGDNAPGEIVKGAVDAVSQRSDIQVLLTGQEEVVRKELEKYSVSQDRITIIPASEIIATDEPPVNAIRRKMDSSIVVGMNLVKKGEADFCRKFRSGFSWRTDDCRQDQGCGAGSLRRADSDRKGGIPSS